MHTNSPKRYDFEGVVRAFVREVLAERYGEASAQAFLQSEGGEVLVGALSAQLVGEGEAVQELLHEFRDGYEAQVVEACRRWLRCRAGLAYGRRGRGDGSEAGATATEASGRRVSFFAVPLELLTPHEREQTELFAQWLSGCVHRRVGKVLQAHGVEAERIASVLGSGASRGCVAQFGDDIRPLRVGARRRQYAFRGFASIWGADGVDADEASFVGEAWFWTFPREGMYGVEVSEKLAIGLVEPSASGKVLWVLSDTACLECPACRFVLDMFETLRSLCESLAFWTWGEVYEAGVRGVALPARAGVCRCSLGGKLFPPRVELHLLPFYAPETVKRLYQWLYEAVLPRLEARSWAQLMMAGVGVWDIREWLGVDFRWKVETLWREWCAHAPTEWQYRSASGKRVFGNALRSAWARVRRARGSSLEADMHFVVEVERAADD